MRIRGTPLKATAREWRPHRISGSAVGGPYTGPVIPHGADELIELAEGCLLTQQHVIKGWNVDAWYMTVEQVDLAIDAYAAVLAGGANGSVRALLDAEGIDVESLLVDPDHARESITRADVAELIAAASLIADPGHSPDDMYMPNIPMMSRRKSDSGIDILVLSLGEAPEDELSVLDHLSFISVKHSVDEDSAQSVRWKLANSLSDSELTAAYAMTQLRVLNGRLRERGIAPHIAERVYMFIRHLPSSEHLTLVAVAVVHPDLADNLIHQVESLPTADGPADNFRMVFVPDLRTLHTRCP